MGVAKERAEDEIEMTLIHGDEEDEEEEDTESLTEGSSVKMIRGGRTTQVDISKMLKHVLLSKRVLLLTLIATTIAFVGIVPGRLLSRMYTEHILPNRDADDALTSSVLTLRQRYVSTKMQQAHLRYLWTLKDEDLEAYRALEGTLGREHIGLGNKTIGPTKLTTLANESYTAIDAWRATAERYVKHGKNLKVKEEQEARIARSLGIYYRLPESEVFNQIYMEVSQFIQGEEEGTAVDAAYVELCKQIVGLVLDLQERMYLSLMYGTQALKSSLLTDSEDLIAQLRVLQRTGPLAAKAADWVQQVQSGSRPLLTVIEERQALVDVLETAEKDPPPLTDADGNTVRDVTPFTYDEFLRSAVGALHHAERVEALSAMQNMQFNIFSSGAEEVNERRDAYIEDIYWSLAVPIVGFLIAWLTLPRISGLGGIGFSICGVLTIVALAVACSVVQSVMEHARDDERALTRVVTSDYEVLNEQVMDSMGHLECWVLVDQHLALGTEATKLKYEDCFRRLKGEYDEEKERLVDVKQVSVMRSKVHMKEVAMERALERLQQSEARYRVELQSSNGILSDRVMDQMALLRYNDVPQCVELSVDIEHTLFHLKALRRRVPKDIINYVYLVGRAQGGWGLGWTDADNSTGMTYTVGAGLDAEHLEISKRLAEAKPQLYISHALTYKGIALEKNIRLLLGEHERVSELLVAQLNEMADLLPASVVYNDNRVNFMKYATAAALMEDQYTQWWGELTEILFEVKGITEQHPGLDIVRQYYLEMPRPSFRGEAAHELKTDGLLEYLALERSDIVTNIRSVSWICVIVALVGFLFWIAVWHVMYHDSWYTLQGYLKDVRISNPNLMRRESQTAFWPSHSEVSE